MERITILEAKKQILAHEDTNPSESAREEFKEELYEKYEIIDINGEEVTRGCMMCPSVTNCGTLGTEEM